MKDMRSLLLGVRNRHFIATDLLIFAVGPTLAFLMRLESVAAFAPYASSLIIYTWIFLVVKPLVFWRTRLYSPFWAYAGMDALKVLVHSSVAAFAVELLLFFGLIAPFGLLPTGLPRSLPLINGVITMVLVGSTRLAVRMLFELADRKHEGTPTEPILIAGAGVAGGMIVKELRMNPQVGLKPAAFLDDDVRLHGRRIHGVLVAGPLSSLSDVVKRYNARQVIIAMPTAPGRVIRDLVHACKTLGIASRTVPGLFEIVSGSARVSELREIQIEDLLRRGVIRSDPRDVFPLLQSRRVMVTGAGGSIGSELCRQIHLCEPAEIILLGHGENSIFKIRNELKRRLPDSKVVAVIADTRDQKRMSAVFQMCRPEIIFHAAAHKHVRLMQENMTEAITNNILGTRNLVELAAQYDVQRLVMISSDKAVNPTSVMGVTKRIAELVVRDAAVTTGKPYVSVRFGNVLGSRGSVVPIFKAQIAMGGPVTVSDPRVTRYFMTIPEAVHLVLQAGAMGAGGEVFVLDMGEPVRILDLARDVIRLSGLVEGKDIDILFTGLQPGEKLHEELFLDSERPVSSKHEKIFVCYNGTTPGYDAVLADTGVERPRGQQGREGDPVFRQMVQELIEAAQSNKLQTIQDLVKRIVPEYHSSVLPIASTSVEKGPKTEQGTRSPLVIFNNMNRPLN